VQRVHGQHHVYSQWHAENSSPRDGRLTCARSGSVAPAAATRRSRMYATTASLPCTPSHRQMVRVVVLRV
jgi:hypothetical protein